MASGSSYGYDVQLHHVDPKTGCSAGDGEEDVMPMDLNAGIEDEAMSRSWAMSACDMVFKFPGCEVGEHWMGQGPIRI